MVEAALRPREAVQLTLVGKVVPPLRGVAVRRRLEVFFGRLSGTRVVVLTSQRLLVVRARGTTPGQPGWKDLQLERPPLRAQPVQTRGRLVHVPLSTGLGERELLAEAAGQGEAARRLARLLLGGG